MDEKIICKTMLYSYHRLEELSQFAEEKSLCIAKNSANNNIFEVFEKMTYLINEKIAYCNVKVIIDEAFAKMSQTEEIKLFDIKRHSLPYILKKLNISQRTFFRRLKKQRETLFAKILKKYDGAKLFEIISDSRWLMFLYKRLLREEQEKGGQNESNKG